MAFFKFRWPGQKRQDDKSTQPSRAQRTENIDVMRRRARHRLIGAGVLVLLGVIGFPMLFDTQPRPIPVDIPIEIPDRNRVAPLVVPAGAPNAVAVAQAPTSQTSAAASLSDGEEVVEVRLVVRLLLLVQDLQQHLLALESLARVEVEEHEGGLGEDRHAVFLDADVRQDLFLHLLARLPA